MKDFAQLLEVEIPRLRRYARVLTRDLARADDLVALDEALSALAAFDERKARVVEMKFFAGLSVEETAAVLKVSPRSVERDWTLARAWLMRELAH